MFYCFLPAAIWFSLFVSSENTEQRKLATIMFSDMKGYSALRRWVLPRFTDLFLGNV
jgi:hypothetical protein